MDIRVLLGIASVSMMLFGFQNCSEVDFANSDSTNLKANGVPGPSVPDVVEGLENDNDPEDIVEEDRNPGNRNNGGQSDNRPNYDNPADAIADYPCDGDNGERKVQVCHVPPGNPAAQHTICIGIPALNAHLHHGHRHDGEEHDYLGPCVDSDNSDNPDNSEDPDDSDVAF